MTDSTRLVTNSQRIAPTRTESVLKVRFVQYGRHRRLTNDGSSVVDITYDYEAADVTAEQLASTAPEDIKTCLHAGLVPQCMESILSDARVEEVVKYNRETTDSDIAKMSLEEMISKAREGYFSEFCNYLY